MITNAWGRREPQPNPGPSDYMNWTERAMFRMLKDCGSCQWFREGPGGSMRQSYWFCDYDQHYFSKGKFQCDCPNYLPRPIDVDSASVSGEAKV